MAASIAQTVGRRGLILGLIVALVLPLGGCWDTIELNDRGIVSSLGFDRTEEGFTVWAAILEPVQFKGEAKPIPVRVVSGKGRTIEDAIVKMQDGYIPRLYFGHLQWLIVSERLAKGGISDMLEWINRSIDRRLAQGVIVAEEGGLVDLLETAAPQAQRSLSVVQDTMAPKSGGSANLGPFLEDLSVAGRDPIAGSFRPKFRSGKRLLKDEYQFDGICLFQDDRMVAKLDPDDSVPFLLLNGDLRAGYAVQSVVNVSKIGRAAVTWNGSPSQRRVKLVGNRVIYEVSFVINGRLSELKDKTDPYDEEGIQAVQDALAQSLAVEMKAVFQKLQAMGVDSLGVGQILHAEYPAYWRARRKTFYQGEYQKVELVVNAKVRLTNRGLTSKRLKPAGQNEGEEYFGAKPEE